MGYNVAAAKLNVEGQEHTTVKWVTDVLTWLNYTYNLVAIADFIENGYAPDIKLFEAIIDAAPESGLPAAILGLESMISEEGARLRLEELTTGHTFHVEISGIDKVIDAFARIFDPARRREHRVEVDRKKEEARHAAETNKSKEHVENAEAERAAQNIKMKAANEKLAGYGILVETHARLNDQLTYLCSEQDARRIMDKIGTEIDRMIGIQPASVRMIEGPTPE